MAAEAAAQPDPDACLRRLRAGLLRLGFSRAGIWVIDPSDPGWLHGTWGTNWEAEELDEHALRFPIGSFLSSEHLAAGRKAALRCFARPAGAPGAPHVVEDECAGPPNHAAVGMRADGELLGIISVDMLLGTESIDADHVVALEFLADQVAVAIARGRAVADLRTTNEALRAMIRASPLAIVVVGRAGEIQMWNPAAERTFGWSATDVLGNPFPVVSAAGRAQFEAMAARVWRGESLAGVEIRPTRADGSRFDASLSLAPLDDANGNVVGIMGIIADVTERKCVEEALRESNYRLGEALAELQQTQQQVIQQERLRALGEMASGVAHDFNNALAHILGYVELLLEVHPEDINKPDVVRRYLEWMHLSAKDAANVVSRLREFYRFRGERDVFVPVDLNQVVAESIFLTQPRWQDQALAGGITVQVTSDLGDVPLVSGSASDLREVLTNLVFNAVDAMPRGGEATIRTRAEGDQVILEVEDTGTGMSEEVRRRCLEPFFTTKGQRGTGMGLAMTYGIVHRHQGTIDVVSAVGLGTTIRIRLPIDQSTPRSSPPATASSERLPMPTRA